VLWRESYYPFGQKWQATLNRDKPSFTGHVEDSATGLTYMQARYYDPVLGRFLAPDPVGFAQGGVRYFNRYAYTANDPVNATDPDGKCTIAYGSYSATCPAKAAYEADPQQYASDVTAVASFAGGAVLSALPVAGLFDASKNLASGNLAGAAVDLASATPVGKIAKAADVAASAVSGVKLQKQLASEQQLGQLAGGGGTVISQPARQADAISSSYGVSKADVQKVASDQFQAKDGTTFETHAWRDEKTNQVIEPKTVIKK
jgi:RHS repeat-associated protein